MVDTAGDDSALSSSTSANDDKKRAAISIATDDEEKGTSSSPTSDTSFQLNSPPTINNGGGGTLVAATKSSRGSTINPYIRGKRQRFSGVGGDNDDVHLPPSKNKAAVLGNTFVARMFEFPSSDDGNGTKYNNNNNINTNINTSINTPTNNNNSIKPSATSKPKTIFSTYDHQSRTESFPLDIPSERHRIISSCIAKVWGITSPRPFQIFAVYCMVYLSSQFIYLIRKTGEGKSLVFLTVATMLRGITIVLVPLIGLGCDQVNKCIKLQHGIEAYHIDENKGEDFSLLCSRLLAITTNNGRTATSTILFCSPQSLEPNSSFSKILLKLAERNIITSVFIDEAHTIHRDGKQGSNFRPEFDIGCSNLINIIKTQKTVPNISAMSATLTEEYESTVNTLIKRQPTIVCCGDMSRRSIYIGIHIFGSPSAAIKRHMEKDYNNNPNRKMLIFTNSKANAGGTLTRMAESVLDTHKVEGEVIALTGECGVMMKTFLMRMFCGSNNDGGEEDEDDIDLPNLLVVPVTAAGNVGISSMDCDRAYRYSLPPSLIDMMQEIGRVDRGHDAAPGEHIYGMFMSFNDVMNLFVRILQHGSSSVREFELNELFAVLKIAVLPKQCMHIELEDYFERAAANVVREPCGNMCTFCAGGHLEFTKCFNINGLRNVLLSSFCDKGSVSLPDFKKLLTQHANKIYGGDEVLVKSLSPGNLHALGLQLVASSFVEVTVKDDNLIGKETLQKKDIVLKLGKKNDDLLIIDNANWEKHPFNCA